MAARWTGLALASLRQRGISGTWRYATAYLGRVIAEWRVNARVEGPWNRRLERRFDRDFGVETAAIVTLPELQSDPKFRLAVNYGPTPHSVFSRMMRDIRRDPSGFAGSTFIDFGCGKGKVVLMAAGLPFRRIVGVELSPKLLATAAENLARYRGPRVCQDLELVCADAADYVIPPEPAILYFHNPFEAEVMQTVLSNIRRSLEASPRPCHIVYFHARWKELFDHAPFLVPVKRHYLYSIYRTRDKV